MNHATQIQHLIDQIKQLPNSLARNKTISKLEDAHAWALQLNVSKADPSAAPCSCRPGMLNNQCPTHGKEVIIV